MMPTDTLTAYRDLNIRIFAMMLQFAKKHKHKYTTD